MPRLFFLLSILAFISGCAPQPLKLDDVAVGEQARSAQANALYKNSIAVINSGAKRNNFEAGLAESLRRINWLDSFSGSAKFHLTGQVSKETLPSAGLTMTGEIVVVYTLKDSATGSVLLTETIGTSSTKGAGDTLVGTDRVRMVIAEYVQENIRRAINRIEASASVVAGKVNIVRQQQIKAVVATKIKQFDFFSSKSFLDEFPPAAYGNYQFSSAFAEVRDDVFAKASVIELEALKRFRDMYGRYLSSVDVDQLDAIIVRKEKRGPSPSSAEKKSSPPPKTTQKPVPSEAPIKRDSGNPFM